MTDVLRLIDRFDDTVANATTGLLGTQLRVDRAEANAILEEMRATLPDEVKNARWITKERNEMMAEARREAERILSEARDERARLIGEADLASQAERRAERIVESGLAGERQIRLRSEDYADDILASLEMSLERFRAAVRRGRERLLGPEGARIG